MWEGTIEQYALPAIGQKPVAEIRFAEIIEMLKPIWTAKEETARRVLQRVEAVFISAIAHELRDKASPCIGVAAQLGRTRKHSRHLPALPWEEVPAFLEQLRASGGMLSSRLAFELLVLTATRSGETRGALWQEIDLDAKLWTIPGSRIDGPGMKMGIAHVVPLSTRAIAILQEARAAWPKSEIVFPGAKGQILSDMTLTKRLRDMKLGDRATAHGFRTSFKNFCAEHGVRDEVSESGLITQGSQCSARGLPPNDLPRGAESSDGALG